MPAPFPPQSAQTVGRHAPMPPGIFPPPQCSRVAGSADPCNDPKNAKTQNIYFKSSSRVTTRTQPGCKLVTNEKLKGACVMKRLAFVLAAALFALTGCTSAAETATAETFPVTEATAEPTSKPAAAETGPLYTYATAMRRMLSMMSCLPLMTSWTTSERTFTKTT